MLHRLLLLLFSLLASFPLAAQDRPRAALAPVGSLDVPTAQQVILFNRLQDRLSTRYDLVSQSDFASAQDEVFTSLTAEECTEENCIRLIQELLQVEDYFHLQLVRWGWRICIVYTNEVISEIWRTNDAMSSLCSSGLDSLWHQPGCPTLPLPGLPTDLSNTTTRQRSSP